MLSGFARCLVDKRAPEKIRHTLEDLIGQRVFGIACGHPDGNDADHLAEDPIHKLLLGRDPVTGERLASQPTLSRFENGVGRGALYRMARELAESVIERHRQRRQGRARRITIDLDPTDDPTHGAQQLTFFNGFYDTWCYLPLLAFVTFGREAEQYLCAAVLRSGKAVASEGAVALLSRLLPLLRCAFPRARFLVRLDAGFATPEVFDFLDACPRLDYVISIPKNAVLLRHAEPAMTRARARSARSGRTEHVYGETRYAAGSWKQQRRVVIKAEVVRLAGREPRDNPRFVVTNLGRPPQSLYEKVYCARGDIENRIKELLDGLQIDRTSCCPVRREPVAGPADGRRLRAHAGAPAVRRTHRLCPNPGDLAARPAPEAGRSCRPLPPPCRPASATRHALPRRVAPHRTRPRSTHWIGPTDPHHQASTHRDRPSHGWSFRCRPFFHPPSPSPDRPIMPRPRSKGSATPVASPSRPSQPYSRHLPHSARVRIEAAANNPG